ncbi:hypothetical protein N7508_004024 [Penicillium antarcticum]|uniref:uncharacterized protein n=1 Tax=Penicillium antarcticum TaxID=416450 RepID=UPI0023A14463|nr:uncharacterized protein N7508_004024 [Penicillium antarcticum]KAJ5308645.1 hypothetical protein N7508_004024 [Penicillium antarcticum]
MSQVRVAVTQAEPVWPDPNATFVKTCKLTSEAAENGYPAVLKPNPFPNPILTYNEFKFHDSAATCKIVVVLGFSEDTNDSLYIAQAILDADSGIRPTTKRTKARHMERTIFDDSFGDCLDGVADIAAGRVGALSCWEPIQPLVYMHSESKFMLLLGRRFLMMGRGCILCRGMISFIGDLS